MNNKAFIQNKTVAIIALLIIATILSLTTYYFFYNKTDTSISVPIPKPQSLINFASAASKLLISGDDLKIEEYKVNPQVPAYSLPLNVSDISNWQQVISKVQIGQQAQSLLGKNGFAVISTPDNFIKNPDRFASYYTQLKYKDLPVFITSDSLLHYYHIFFDTTLMKLERDLFYDDTWSMSKELLDQSIAHYQSSSGDLKEAAKRNAAYLSVALKLLQPKPEQVISDQTLVEEYCSPGATLADDYCQMMVDGVKKTYGEKTSYKYFSQEEATKYSFEIPNDVKSLVDQELDYIEKHEGWSFSPILIYKEDYSQYVPRGHYAKSEKLKNYFKALMWYGRMTAVIKGSEQIPPGISARKLQEDGVLISQAEGILSTYDAKIQTMQASLLSLNFASSANIQEKWQRMYAITGFFVGFSDDLGPMEYSETLKATLGETINLSAIETNYENIRDTLTNLEYNPKIYSGLDAAQLVLPSCPPLSEAEIDSIQNQAAEILANTKGFRFMGQRFTVDSYLFSEIVSPYSGEFTGTKNPLPTSKKPFTFAWDDEYSDYRKNRPLSWTYTAATYCPEGREVKGFPLGLDVMAIFGSERAKTVLNQTENSAYSDYQKQFNKLKQGFDSLALDQWYQNIYWNWLYVLKSLFSKYDDGYPTFMRTDAWQDKELNTALASWAELRHDTILYVKQSYTIAEMGGGGEKPKIVGYVEPVPEFYSRLLTLTNMTNAGLQKLIPAEELEKLDISTALTRFSGIIERLLDMSVSELENKELTDQDYEFIDDFGKTSSGLIELVSGGDMNEDVLKTTLVADVHTDGNTEKALEEAVGYIKTMLVAYKVPSGHILLGVGPVFSYYEFKQPISERLTDEAWRDMLQTTHPPEPDWIKSFSE